MTAADVVIQIRSLRAQLDVLEARLRSVPVPEQHTFADLRGMLTGQTQTTAEEIDAIQYRGIHEDQR